MSRSVMGPAFAGTTAVLHPHAGAHFLRKQIVGRELLRRDALVVREAAEGVERLAVGFEPIGKRIVAEVLAELARRSPPTTAPECAKRSDR